ncbi:Uncharacterized protein FWK35_00027596, partial [Aphis craccivora]
LQLQPLRNQSASDREPAKTGARPPCGGTSPIARRRRAPPHPEVPFSLPCGKHINGGMPGPSFVGTRPQL